MNVNKIQQLFDAQKHTLEQDGTKQIIAEMANEAIKEFDFRYVKISENLFAFHQGYRNSSSEIHVRLDPENQKSYANVGSFGSKSGFHLARNWFIYTPICIGHIDTKTGEFI